METITYKYSAFRAVFITMLIFAIDIFVICGAITTGDNGAPMIIAITILVGMLIYFGYKVFLPTLHGKTILEIDAEKLQYTFKNLTLYWKDIEDIDYEDYSFDREGWTPSKIKFTMKGSGADKRISTWFIAGDNAAIFDSVLTTFLKYR